MAETQAAGDARSAACRAPTRDHCRDPEPARRHAFQENGEPLAPGHSSKGPARIRYRYYVYRLTDA